MRLALTEAPRPIHGWGAFSPDETKLACPTNGRDPAHADLCVIDIATHAVIRSLEVQGPQELPGWYPDGSASILSTAPRFLFAPHAGVEKLEASPTRRALRWWSTKTQPAGRLRP